MVSAAFKGKTDKDKKIPVEEMRGVVTSAIVSILMPLTSLALEMGFSIEDVYKLLRLAAVNQLSNAAKINSTKLSISGVAAVTGIPRAEVSKLLKRAAPSAKTSRVNEQSTNAILAAWREDSRFTTANGQPDSLKMYGRGRSFERLAKLHGRGIPTRALLEELKRTNSVSVGPDQTVHQNASISVELGITTTSVRTFAEQVSDLMTTLIHNMKNTEGARLISRVSSNQVSADQLPLLKREISKLTEHYLSESQDLLARNSMQGRKNAAGTSLSITIFCSEQLPDHIKKTRRKRTNYRRLP